VTFPSGYGTFRTCECQEIDDLVGLGADDMGAENLTRTLLDRRFIAIHPLRETAGGKPIGGVLRLHFELQSLLLRLSVLQTHGGDWRHRESYTRHPSIIWLMTIISAKMSIVPD
jgi:hypothetical protein